MLRVLVVKNSAVCNILPAPWAFLPPTAINPTVQARGTLSMKPLLSTLGARHLHTVSADALGRRRVRAPFVSASFQVCVGFRSCSLAKNICPSVFKCGMATKAGRSDRVGGAPSLHVADIDGGTQGEQENLRENYKAINEALMQQYGQNALGAPSLHVADIDVEQMEMHTKAIIKRSNFYGKILLASLVMGGVLMYISYAATDVTSGLLRHTDGLLDILYTFLPENIPNPETSHRFVVWLAARGWLPLDLNRDDPALSVNVKGITFHTPVGLAAGFDKNAVGTLGFCKMGFGFVEVGTITPKPQNGNPKPRIFRLSHDHALINHCGFDSEGLNAVEPRLREASKERWHDRLARRCVIGVNLSAYRYAKVRVELSRVTKLTQGQSADTEHANDDIREGVKRIGRFADYLVINLNSPSTKAQGEIKQLEAQNQTLRDKKAKEKENSAKASQAPEDLALNASDFFPTQTGRRPLLFVKISPDLTDEQKREIAQVALETGLDGLVVANPTIQRPDFLKSKNKQETGDLSGRPLKSVVTKCVSEMYKLTKGQVAIIASGGVESGLDAFEHIKAGASAIEIYTAMFYRGPIVARRVKDELLGILNQAGIYNVQDAVGLDHRPPKKTRFRKPTFD